MTTMKTAAGGLRIHTAASTQDTGIVAQVSDVSTLPSGEPQAKPIRFTMRQQRVLDALLTTAGALPRELVDQIAGASNGPAVISRLRAKLGHDAIETSLAEIIDRDGRTARPGRYRLTAEGRARLVQGGLVRHG